jgi:hypothetical protein
MSIMDQLDILLEETTSTWDDYTDPDELVDQLHKARLQVKDLEFKISSLKTKMSADLALALRRTNPALNVGLDRSGCKVGYKTKSITFEPDIENRKWNVKSTHPRFLGLFNRDYKDSLPLTADLGTLVDAINNHFTNYYKSIGESVSGTGLLLVEGRSANLSQIITWRSINAASR